MFSLKTWEHLAICTLLVGTLAGCVLPSAMEQANSVDNSGSSVVVVGKIEIVPPLDAVYEQKTHWNVIGDEAILNKIVMATGTDPKPVDTDLVLSEWQNAIEAELGKNFFLKGKRQRTYLKGAMVNLDVKSQDRLWFPGGLYYDVPNGADAVYVGTLRYTRDDFNKIKKVELINEYKSASREFSSRFGKGARLTQSLLKSAKVD